MPAFRSYSCSVSFARSYVRDILVFTDTSRKDRSARFYGWPALMLLLNAHFITTLVTANKSKNGEQKARLHAFTKLSVSHTDWMRCCEIRLEKERKQCHFPICESDRVSTVDFSLFTRYHELVSLTLYAPRFCHVYRKSES